MSSISTQRGDGGQTSLIGGQRVSKSSLRVEAYGTIDELNAALGLARSFCKDQDIQVLVHTLQKELFVIGTSLAQTHRQNLVTPLMVERLTKQVHDIENLDNILTDEWSITGQHPSPATFDLARTICRRAERNILRLQETGEQVEAEIIPYMNRLSDLLWLLSRWIESRMGIDSRLYRE